MRSTDAPFDLMVLYRGPLETCNDGCSYCPFAKRPESAEAKASDEAALNRFIDAIARLPFGAVGILFTPWGEALPRRRYQRALLQLAAVDHVRRVAVQSNLSMPPDWLVDEAPEVIERIGLWATFHPTEVALDTFLERVWGYRARGCAISVGGVALDEHRDAMQVLSDRIPPDVPLWVNAAKRVHGPYDASTAAWWTALDPTFPTNTVQHSSAGRACRTGEDTIAVDGNGDIRRCHFVDEVLGNLFVDDVRALLRPRPCPIATCGCHIGYVHMPALDQRRLYGDGLLERRRLPLVAQGA